MPAAQQQEQFRLGFLTTIRLSDGGYVGGLLVTNRLGRPLEFQCTLPVKPNHTQEILYGPTLVPFLLGELIGKTLVEKAGVKPDIILAEQPEILELREHISIPVACINTRENDATIPADRSPSAVEACPEITVAKQRLRFHPSHGQDLPRIESKAKLIPAEADLAEPFERVREALKEATQSTVPR